MFKIASVSGAPSALAISPPTRTYFLVYPMQVLDHGCVSDTLPLTSMRWRGLGHAQGLSPLNEKPLLRRCLSRLRTDTPRWSAVIPLHRPM